MLSYPRSAQFRTSTSNVNLLRNASWFSLAAAIAATLATPATAATEDVISPFVSSSYTYDDNLFRLAETTAGGVQSDRIKALVAGANFSRQIGQQVLSASGKVTKVMYDRFDMLNYDGKDFSGQWRWQVSRDVEGTAGVSYLQTLTSFSDYGSRERNLHRQRSEYVDGGWRLFPHWRVRGRFSRDKSEYDLISRQFLDRTDNASELGLDYRASTRSTIGIQARKVKGNYVHPIMLGDLAYDQSFTQNEAKLRVVWNFDEVVQAQFLGGPVRREHKQLQGRDASGTNLRMSTSWQTTPSLGINAVVYKEFAPFEGSGFSYSLNKGSALSAKWNAGYRILVEGEMRQLKRDFSGFRIGSSILGASDKTNVRSLSVTYLPMDKVQVGASLLHDVRTSAAGLGPSYRAKSVSLNATVQF